jgi:hypothetical protein
MSLILSGTDGLSDVDGSAATPAIRGTDANTGIFFPAADTIAFSEGGVEAARIDSAGNLGLGVTPSAWSSFKAMQIGAGTVLYNNSNANGSFLGSNFYWNGSNNIYIGTSTATAYAQTSGQHQWFNAASGTAGNTVSFTQAMTLDTSGNLIIAKTASSSLSAVGCYNETTGSGANMVIASNGFMIRSTSSLKYKKNVQDATHGLADLLKLRSVTYESKNENEDGIVYGGLIAEEVDAAGLTEFVQYADDKTPDALSYGNMVSLCIKAIQEMKTIIDEQAQRISVLEAK